MSVSATSSGYADPNNFMPVFASENATTAAETKAQGARHLTVFGDGDDSPSFWDLLDVINPLQHIPVVNEIYQDLTGDKIGVAARLAGGTLFGGPIGLVASAIGCLVEEETGDSLGGHVLALFRDDAPDGQSAPTQMAAATAAPDTPAPTAAPTSTPAPAAPKAEPAALRPQEPLSAAVAPADLASAPTAPLMFNAEGLITSPVAPAAAPVAVATAPVAVASVQAAAPAKAAMPLLATAQPARFMPTPARTVVSAETTPPPISVPVSNGSNRSNVPVTGRDPLAHRAAPDPVAVQKAMAQQGLAADVQHPMLQGATATGGSDWVGAMNQALNKYQRAGNLAARPQSPDPQPLQ